MTTSIADVLNDGAKRLEDNGWFQAGPEWVDGRGPRYCALTSMHDGWYEAACELAAFVGLNCASRVATWNNAPGQTKENVIATMRACAAIWRAKHEERQSEAVTESSAEKVSA